MIHIQLPILEKMHAYQKARCCGCCAAYRRKITTAVCLEGQTTRLHGSDKRFHAGNDIVDRQAGAGTSGLNVDSGLIQPDHQLGTPTYDDAEYEVCIPMLLLQQDNREINTLGDAH